MVVILNLTREQRSERVFIHWCTCLFKLSERSIITKQPLSICALPLVDSEGQRQPKSQSWRPERWWPLNLCRLVRSPSRSHFESHARSLSPGFCSSSVWRTTLYRMSSLKDICSGLPLDPLPPNRGRDPNVPHAPIRTPNLTAEEERVSWHAVRLHAFSCVLKRHAQTVKQWRKGYLFKCKTAYDCFQTHKWTHSMHLWCWWQ